MKTKGFNKIKNENLPWVKIITGIACLLVLFSCAYAPSAVPGHIVGSNPEYRGSWAQVPVILSRIQVPNFPDRTLIVTNAPYNAKADGVSDDREAIQNAIIDISRFGGGVVNIPAGKYLIDGPLHLENNVNFHLEEDAELLFSTNYDSYLPQVLTRYEGADVYNFSPLIYVYQKKNVAITGKGTLNGQAKDSWATWVKKASEVGLTRVPGSSKGNWEQEFRDMNNNDVPLFERMSDRSGNLRPHFILFYDSENILLEGVNIVDSPFWINHFYRCKNITVRNIVLKSLNKNNDGIDIESSQDMHIYNVDFATGDDCISIKSSRDLEGLQKMIPSKNIVIQNVRFLADDAIALGSEASGGVRNIFVENSEGSNLRKGFYFKGNNNRGNHFEHIRIRNLTLGDLVDLPENARKLGMIDVTTNYDSIGVKYNRPSEFKDIRLENIITGTSIFPLKLEGSAGVPIKDFVLDRVHLGAGQQPNVITDIDLKTLFIRDVTVGNKPLSALVEGSKEEKIIQQNINIPPDVYAGEEQVISLSQKNVITLMGDAVDKEHSLSFKWEAIPEDAEKVSIGEDSNGNSIHYRFGDEKSVHFAHPDALITQVTFTSPGMYRLRLNVSDSELTGYHTVFIEVRK